MPPDVADSLRLALACMSTFVALRKSGLVDPGFLLNGELAPSQKNTDEFIKEDD